MIGQLSRQTVRQTWRPYAGAFVALACGIILIATTVTLVGSVDVTARHDTVSPADRAQLDDLASMFGFMAAVSLFMALFVVASTFGFVVATRRRELGLLRLIGATPRQVRRLILGESSVVAVLATVVGCASATALSPAVLWLLRERGITDLHLQAPNPWVTWAIAAPCGAGVALIGAWRASRRAAQVPPVAALLESVVEKRRLGPAQALVGSLCLAMAAATLVVSKQIEPLIVLSVAVLLPEVLVIGLVCVGGVIFPTVGALLGRPFAGLDPAARLASDHTRAGARTPAALAAPIVAISAVAGSLILSLSFATDWTSAQDRSQLAAPVVVEIGSREALEAVTEVEEAGVLDVRRTLQFPVGVDSEAAEVDAVDVGAASVARGLTATHGDLTALKGRTLAVTESWSLGSGKGVGDTVAATIGGTQVRLRIVAVVRDAPDLYGELLVPRVLAERQATQAVPRTVFVVPRDGVSASELRAALALKLGHVSARVFSSDVWIARVAASARLNNQLGLWLLLGPAGLYAAIAIINVILIAASQRRRQLRVVRLIGGTRAQIRRMALWEAGSIGAAAVLVGGLVTAYVGWLVRRAITADLPNVPMTVPWVPLAATALTCVALALLAAAVGVRGAHESDRDPLLGVELIRPQVDAAARPHRRPWSGEKE